jgi:hypothetical protein
VPAPYKARNPSKYKHILFLPHRNLNALSHKDQLVKNLQEKRGCILWESHETHNCSVGKTEFLNVKAGGIYSNHCALKGQHQLHLKKNYVFSEISFTTT